MAKRQTTASKAPPGGVGAGDRGIASGRDVNAGILITGDIHYHYSERTTPKRRSPGRTRQLRGQLDEVMPLAEQVNIAGEELVKLYRECLPMEATPIASENLTEILIDLNTLPLQSSNRVPLFDFVTRLSQLDAASRVRDQLLAWLGQAKAASGISTMPQIAENQLTASQQQVRAILEVQLVPDLGNVNRPKGKLYSVEVALWKSDVGYLTTFRSPLGNEPLTLDKVPELLADVLANSNSLRHVGSLAELTFEFILPIELLSHAVERWKPKQGPVPGNDDYGMTHRLVVRSLERMKFYATDAYQGTQLYDVWKSKWHSFRQTAARHANALRWLALDGRADPCALIDRLRQDPEAHSLGLDTADESALSAVVWAGIPVALWAREPAANGQSLSTLLKEVPNQMDVLPVWIKTVRSGAARQTYPHNCLALLWDDPTRLPLRYQPEGVFRDEQLENIQGKR